MLPKSLLGAAITAAFANLVSYLIFHFPIIYCAGVWAAQPFEAWVASVRIIMALLAIIAAAMSQYAAMRQIFGVWIAFELIPVIFAAVFSFGVSCNSTHPTILPEVHHPVGQLGYHSRVLQ